MRNKQDTKTKANRISQHERELIILKYDRDLALCEAQDKIRDFKETYTGKAISDKLYAMLHCNVRHNDAGADAFKKDVLFIKALTEALEGAIQLINNTHKNGN